MTKINDFLFGVFTIIFLGFLVLGGYGFFDDYGFLKEYTTVLSISLIIAGFVLYILLLKFVLKFSIVQILNRFGYVLGILFCTLFLLGYFLLWEIYAWILYSIWIIMLFIGIGIGLLLGAYYVAGKIRSYRGPLTLLLLFGSEFCFIGFVSLAAGRFLI